MSDNPDQEILPEQILPEPTVAALPRSQSVFLGGLFVMAVLAACHAASAIILPIVLAIILKLFLQPVMRFLGRLGLPRMAAAFVTISVLVTFFAVLGTVLSGPIGEWADRLPAGIGKIQSRLSHISAPFSDIQDALESADVTSLTSDTKTVTVAVAGTSFADHVLEDMTLMIRGLFITTLVLFFMLMSGDTFLRRLVEILPRFRDKKQAVEIFQQIECDISGYLTTITIMNMGIGVATAIIMAACGIDDPLLWGSIAFLMNYIPTLGPIITTAMILFVGMLSFDNDLHALLPAGLYLLVRTIESNAITPLLIARRLTLNPVLVVLSLVFWYWMWGVPGAILSTPMLAVVKIIFGRVERLKPISHFMEGEPPAAAIAR